MIEHRYRLLFECQRTARSCFGIYEGFAVGRKSEFVGAHVFAWRPTNRRWALSRGHGSVFIVLGDIEYRSVHLRQENNEALVFNRRSLRSPFLGVQRSASVLFHIFCVTFCRYLEASLEEKQAEFESNRLARLDERKRLDSMSHLELVRLPWFVARLQAPSP